jgi:hypothetical protein
MHEAVIPKVSRRAVQAARNIDAGDWLLPHAYDVGFGLNGEGGIRECLTTIEYNRLKVILVRSTDIDLNFLTLLFLSTFKKAYLDYNLYAHYLRGFEAEHLRRVPISSFDSLTSPHGPRTLTPQVVARPGRALLH